MLLKRAPGAIELHFPPSKGDLRPWRYGRLSRKLMFSFLAGGFLHEPFWPLVRRNMRRSGGDVLCVRLHVRRDRHRHRMLIAARRRQCARRQCAS